MFASIAKRASMLEVNRMIDSARGSINLTGASRMGLLYVWFLFFLSPLAEMKRKK